MIPSPLGLTPVGGLKHNFAGFARKITLQRLSANQRARRRPALPVGGLNFNFADFARKIMLQRLSGDRKPL